MVTFTPKALGPQQMQLEAQVLTSVGTSIVWSRPIFLSGLASSPADKALPPDVQAATSALTQVCPLPGHLGYAAAMRPDPLSEQACNLLPGSMG